MSAKVIVLCLDASDPEMLHRLIESGELPFLASLNEKGSALPFRNLKGFGDGVFWPCASTGVNPAKHGRMYSTTFDPATYARVPFRDDSLHAQQFWEILDDAGLQTATIDVVHAALRPLRHGVLLCDWMTHERQAPARSNPPELAVEWLERWGDDPFNGDTDAFIIETGDYPELLRRLQSRIAIKTAAIERLLRSREWDVFTCGFGEPHDIGHLCWHLSDPDHPRFDAKLAAEIGDPVHDIYTSLDRAMARLCASAGPDASVMVLAGPGMERLTTFNRSLDQILWRLEAFLPATTAETPLSTRAAASRSLAGLWRKAVPEWVRSRVKRLGFVGRLSLRASQHVKENRRFFAQAHNANAGAVRVNLRGREARGKVNPGAEFRSTVEWIANEFRRIHDHKGQPLVSDIAFPTLEHQGDHVDALTDMLIIWNRNVDVSNLFSPTLGALSDQSIIPRTGDHSARGHLWLSGSQARLEAGENVAVPMDLLPTLFDLLGIIKHGGDGHSLIARTSSSASQGSSSMTAEAEQPEGLRAVAGSRSPSPLG